MRSATAILATTFVLSLAGCYEGGEPSGQDEIDGTETGDESGEETGGETAGQTGDESDDTGETGDDPPEEYPEEDCDYVLVHEQLGSVHAVSALEPNFDLMPLAEGEGFYCLRLEFDVTVPDSLEDLIAVHEGCPEYLALASVFGTQATGDYLATSFFHGYELVSPEKEEEDTCMARTPHVEVGNYVDYSEGTQAPWLPGETWHVVLEAKPWLTRIDVEGEVESTHRVEASLFPANVPDTRDPVVRLGQAQVTGAMFYPWFGAEYSNLRVEAVVAPAP